MNDNNPEMFPIEFRHVMVEKLVRGISEGSIVIEWDISKTAGWQGMTTFIGKAKAEILEDIHNYCSGKFHGEQLDQIEQRLFLNMNAMRILNLVKDKLSATQVEQEIAKLHARMDSTNNLLIDILAILKELLKRYDN